MSSSINSVEEICRTRFDEICSDFSSNGKIIDKHYGEFSQDLVNQISNDIEEYMINSSDKKGLVKRMFGILVEGLQNIRLHGEKAPDGHQTSFSVVAQNEDNYRIAMGNLIFDKNKDNISKRIEEVNERDAAGVKQLYMDVLTNGIISSKGGAGLGFITMAMKSKNKLDFYMDEAGDGLTFFTIVVQLDRKKVEQSA